ncbi:MAG: ArsA-related P-loop ATPase [Myxococcota bacterium]
MDGETGRSLLERRLVIVTGKGGTGKTTVSAALALAAARAGRRVLVAEMGRDEQLARILAPGSPPVGYAGRSVAPGVTAMRIDPFEALAEYLGLQLGVRSLVDLVVRNRSFRQLMSASPGWRELITLGKVWHLERMESEPGRPLYDLIVVDAPATGHGVTFLQVPRVVVSAVRAGPLRRQTQQVEDLIEDPHRTLILPVTLAEELPVRETAELVQRVGAGAAIAIDRVVVNGVVPFAFPRGAEDLDERLRRLGDAPLGRLPRPRTLAACAQYLHDRHRLNMNYLALVGQLTDLPIVRLPYLMEGVRGPSDIARLAEALLEPPQAAAA